MRNEHDGERGRKTGLSVVLDTNVYVSIFTHPERPIFQVWTHAVQGHYELVVSPAIVAEFARVSRRDFHWDEKKVRIHVRLINKTAKVVAPKTIPDVIQEDPDDNHILACALAGKANLIVSHDLDLLRLKQYKGIGIMSPIDFLHTLEGFEKAA
jgi:putative PIN family toxin of toxin-antitoxin system